jgi:LAGLIDADG endonuclease
MRALYFIKKQLGYGSIYMESKRNMADFRIRDKDTIGKVLLPIFDNYPLLTSKQFNYIQFKKAYYILTDIQLSHEKKNELLFKIKSEVIPQNYISSA